MGQIASWHDGGGAGVDAQKGRLDTQQLQGGGAMDAGRREPPEIVVYVGGWWTSGARSDGGAGN